MSGSSDNRSHELQLMLLHGIAAGLYPLGVTVRLPIRHLECYAPLARIYMYKDVPEKFGQQIAAMRSNLAPLPKDTQMLEFQDLLSRLVDLDEAAFDLSIEKYMNDEGIASKDLAIKQAARAFLVSSGYWNYGNSAI